MERHLGAWYGESCYHGKDSQDDKQIVLKAFVPADPRIQAYVDFFKECSGMQGIPTFIAHFSTDDSEFIAHEFNGVVLRGILNARMFHISLENTIRLGYRLFRILHAIHLKGYVHRNIQPLSIVCDVGPDEELVVNLSYFGHAARIDELPSNNRIILGPHHSLHVSRGGAYSRIDDYISVVLVMLSCQTINPFDFNTNWHLTHAQKKENFHANPYAVLTPETMWLGDLYLQLEEMRSDRLSHLQVMAALRRAVPGFDPQTAITYRNAADSVYHLID
ncbi:unnamed protein product [Caenorhabditis nigoni]